MQKIIHRRVFDAVRQQCVAFHYILWTDSALPFRATVADPFNFLWHTQKKTPNKKKMIKTTVSSLWAVCILYYGKYHFNLFISGVMNFIFHSPHLLHLNEMKKKIVINRCFPLINLKLNSSNININKKKQSEVILWMHAHKMRLDGYWDEQI